MPRFICRGVEEKKNTPDQQRLKMEGSVECRLKIHRYASVQSQRFLRLVQKKKPINLNENLFFLLIVKEICPDDFGVDPTKRKESDSGFVRIL